MKRTASSKPVVMIHGAFCGGWAFDPWCALFDRLGYAAQAPTLRHHHRAGHAPNALGTTSVLDYVSDLEALLDGIDEPPVLVGHSMGGLLAQLVAARRPVRALILLAPCAPWGVFPATPFEVASANALYMTGDFWNRSLHPEPWIAAANALDNVPEAEQQKVLKRFVPESGRATFEIMHWGFDAARATHIDPADVECPVLCIAGARDRVNSPGTVRSIARRYRGQAAYEEVRGHSHWLIGEPGWEKIAARALAWLDDA
jgi:pimeloyl-ACP methyl ester carboxylesterase